MVNIRFATSKDIQRIFEIESEGFSEAEAASLQSLTDRFDVFPECFVVMEKQGEVVGFVNGCVFDKPELPDALFANAQMHQPEGKYQTIFGLAVAEEYQGLGYASQLLEYFNELSKSRNHSGVVLTCKKHLVEFYEKLGFQNQGLCDSKHGGTSWYKMLLVH